jgi:hypothetical protein
VFAVNMYLVSKYYLTVIISPFIHEGPIYNFNFNVKQ